MPESQAVTSDVDIPATTRIGMFVFCTCPFNVSCKYFVCGGLRLSLRGTFCSKSFSKLIGICPKQCLSQPCQVNIHRSAAVFHNFTALHEGPRQLLDCCGSENCQVSRVARKLQSNKQEEMCVIPAHSLQSATTPPLHCMSTNYQQLNVLASNPCMHWRWYECSVRVREGM